VPPGKYLQVQELLRRLPGDTPPERLRTLLAPLFATNLVQQRQFYEVFDKSLAQAVEVTRVDVIDVNDSDDNNDPNDETRRTARQGERRWRRVVLLFPLLLAALAGFIWDADLGRWYVNPTLWFAIAVFTGSIWAAVRLLTHWMTRSGYLFAVFVLAFLGTRLKPAVIPVPTPEIAPPAPIAKSRILRFSVAPGDTVSNTLVASTDTARLLSTAPAVPEKTKTGGHFQVDNKGEATYIAGTNAQTGVTDTLIALLGYAGRTDTVYCLVDLIEKKTQPSAAPDLNLIAELPLPYPRDIAGLQIDAAEAARFEWYNKYEWPLKILLILLFGALAWAIMRWYRFRRARAVAELRRADKAPYVWSPNTSGSHTFEGMSEVVQPLLTRLRGRAPDDRHNLDIPATIRATSRRAGRVQFAWRRRTLPPNYLLLIDRLAPNDHQAHLFDTLYGAFTNAELPVIRYFYDGDPRRCFNETHPDGVALAELLHRHAGAQLFILGEGQGLLSTADGRPALWTQLLSAWPRRVLLSTRPLSAWDTRERQLTGLVPILPASPGGLSAALDLFSAEDPADTRELLRTVRDALYEPVEFTHDLLSDLQRHFPPAIVDWIAACAIWPTLHWNLTLHLGRALSAHHDTDLLRFEHLRELTRLPWFTEGRMPEGARAPLFDYLAERGLETPLRESLRELLQQTPSPPENSVAYDNYRMNIVLNELFLRPSQATRHRLEREFERYLAAGKKPDFVALRLLDRPTTRLDVLVGERLKKYAFREGLPGLGWKPGIKLVAVWAALSFVLALFQPNLNPCPGERVRYNGREMCLNGDADRLLYLENLAADAIQIQDHERVDSLQKIADAFPETNKAFYQNTAIRYYNYGNRMHNYAKTPDIANWAGISRDSLQNLACENFQRAISFTRDGEDNRFRKALELACKEREFLISGRVLDAASGRPIAKAVVTAVGIADTTTSADGRYTLRVPNGIARAKIRLLAEANGYNYNTRDILLGDSLLFTISLNASTSGRSNHVASARAISFLINRIEINKDPDFPLLNVYANVNGDEGDADIGALTIYEAQEQREGSSRVTRLDLLEKQSMEWDNVVFKFIPEDGRYDGVERLLTIHYNYKGITGQSEPYKYSFGSSANIIELSRPQDIDFRWLSLVGALLLLLLLAIFVYIIAFWRHQKFKRKYVRVFTHYKQENNIKTAVIDEYTKMPIEEDEKVVTKCGHIMTLNSWIANNNHCYEYPLGCKEGFGEYHRTASFFQQTGGDRVLNWCWFGGVGGFLAWVSFTLVKRFVDLAPFEVIFKDIFIEEYNTRFAETLAHQSLAGAVLGFFIILMLSIVEELGQSRQISYSRIFIRSILALLVSTIVFPLIEWMRLQFIPNAFIGQWLVWTLFGALIGLMVTVDSSIESIKGVKGGVIAGVAAFLFYYFLPLAVPDANFANLLSWICYGSVLGLVLVTVVQRLEDFELDTVSPDKYKGRAIPITKWLKERPVYIGTHPSCDVVIEWEDRVVAEQHAPPAPYLTTFALNEWEDSVVAIMTFNGRHVFIKPIKDEVLVNTRLISGKTKLNNGDLIQLGGSLAKSILRFNVIKKTKEMDNSYKIGG